MRILAGEPARLYFTHLSKPSRASLSTIFAASDDRSLAKTACFDLGVHEMIRQSFEGMSSDQVCLLDPKAEAELSPEDGDGRFQWFLFGVSAAEGATLISLLMIAFRAGNSWFVTCFVAPGRYVDHRRFTLGDDPPRDRTAELRGLGLPSRQLGRVSPCCLTDAGQSVA